MTNRSTEIRENILKISNASGHGHVPTCFSIVEILIALYKHMQHRPQEPNWPGRDLFILSKGHASLAHYCTLASYGYFKLDSVYSFGSFGSRFGCHADRLKVPVARGARPPRPRTHTASTVLRRRRKAASLRLTLSPRPRNPSPEARATRSA